MTDPIPTTAPEPKVDPGKPADPQADPTGADKLGDAGKQALDRMKAERNAANEQIKAMEKKFAALEPLTKLADALGVKPEGGKSDVETLTATVTGLQKDLADERLGRLRLEVAAEKGLTPAQAARLAGATRDELAADADTLKGLFPGTAAGGAPGAPGTPAPDPSQGARGGVNDLQAALKAAQDKKQTSEVIRIKTAIAAAQSK